MLVFATVDEVRLYFIKAKQYAPVAKGMKNVVGVAYDGKYIYWTTVADGHEALMRSDVFGTQVEKLFTSGLGIPEDLAVDHLTGNIYLTDSFYKHIAVCDEHGYRCAILYSGCDQPRAIALHHAKGWVELYFYVLYSCILSILLVCLLACVVSINKKQTERPILKKSRKQTIRLFNCNNWKCTLCIDSSVIYFLQFFSKRLQRFFVFNFV